ncbi:MAG TPA: SRPBCC family protein [Chloroflexota bacterium]|nr:SRPBCC family protein [Chloroflexota bacterium]
MQVEVSVLIDAPRDEVFALLTEYGSEARLRVSPQLQAQEVVERQGNVVVCDNLWEHDDKSIASRRRYTLTPPNRIEEEVVEAGTGLQRVTTLLEPEGDQTRLTMTSEYRMSGIWRLLARVATSQMAKLDQEFLEKLRAGIEAEFEEVDADEE